MIISNEVEGRITKIGASRKALIAPLRLDLLENNSNYVKSQSMSTENMTFHDMSHRGISSTESLEYQDKYVTPHVITDDSESDIERAKIVEEAALVAEKLMSSQLSKISYETELRTMETRFPTRVNSPRYYNEKKEVMDRANRMLKSGNRECSSIPGFIQDKFGWFNCVESFFSVCNDEQIVEDNESCSIIETSSYFSPKKKSSTDKNMKILEELKALKNKEGKVNGLNNVEEGRKITNKTPDLASEEKTLKTQSAKKSSNSEKTSTTKKTLGINSSNTKKIQAARSSKSLKQRIEAPTAKNMISEFDSYDIENDVFYLDDGAGYITFNASKLDFSEMEKRSKQKTTRIKSSKDSNKVKSGNSSTKNSDAENQLVSASSITNVNTSNAQKNPTRCKDHLYKTNQTDSKLSDKTKTQVSSRNSKECKKKLRAQKSENTTELNGAKALYSNTDQDVLNYSSNCIRGRMDYISTDVFV